MFAIANSWSGFGAPQKQSWLDAGDVPGMNGYNLFVQDQAYRIKNLLGGFADPSTFHQYLVGHINLSGSAIDLYSALLLTRFLVYEKTGLSAGSHTIKIVLRSDKNPSSTGYNFYFDAFKIGALVKGTNLYLVQAGANFTGNLNANGYSAATFPVFSDHEFISIMGAYLNTPALDQSGLGMRFTDTLASAQNAANSTWQNLDLSSLIPAGADTVEIYIENLNTTAARIAGARANGSSANRYFDISSPDADGRNGYTMTVKLDANRIIQIISEIAADIVFRINGYWKQTRVPKVTINRDTVYLYDGDPNASISLDVYALFMRS